jgi:hypothetical protein
MKYIGLEKILKEGKEYGGFLDGDFNSNASNQSWGQFFTLWFGFGAPVAVGTELSSWHGERNLKYYEHPYGAQLPKEGRQLPLPENYKIDFIRGGMKASDLVEGVKKDENGEYFSYENLGQDLKFYLPSTSWFTTFYLNMPYKFQNEIGEIYTLLLTLQSNKTNTELQTGTDTEKDDMKTSLLNLQPDLGNGWFISPPPDLSGKVFEYYTKVGNNFVPYNVNVMDQSLKSSWQLFWEKWGVVLQIVASVILAYFTSGLTALIEGIFLSLAEAEALAGGAGVFAEVLTWLTASGSFNTSRAAVLSIFLLESVVNVPAALIDRGFNNQFGFWLGIAFCFFPAVSSYGKLGKWIQGKYSQQTVDSMIEKLIRNNVNETMSQEQLFKFITELNAEEKLMWGEMVKALNKKEGAEAIKETIIEGFKNAAKQGDLPSKLQSWWRAGKNSSILKSFIAAGVYFVDVAKWYIIIESLKEKNKDPRSVEKIFQDAQSNIEDVKSKFKKSDSNNIVITSKSDKIITDIIDGSELDNGGELIYNLSKKEDILYFMELVSNRKIEEYKKGTKNNERILNATFEQIKSIMESINEANSYLSEPKSDEEIFSWFDPTDSNVIILQYISSYSDDLMSNEISVAVSRYKCLATNFEYLDGYPLKENKWVLSFKVVKPLKIKYDNNLQLTLTKDSVLWLFDNGNFTYNDIDYKNFKCN